MYLGKNYEGWFAKDAVEPWLISGVVPCLAIFLPGYCTVSLVDVLLLLYHLFRTYKLINVH